jgi:hypothetical protein
MIGWIWAQSLMQIAAQIQPIMSQSGAPLNLKAFMERTLDAYDILDKDRYFMPPGLTPPGGAPAPGAAPGALPAGGPPAPPGQGVTNPALAAGPTSPSNGSSLSGEAAMARMLSMRGGAANAPTKT